MVVELLISRLADRSLSKVCSRKVNCAFILVNYGETSEIFATDIATDPINQEITVLIRDYLKENLHYH